MTHPTKFEPGSFCWTELGTTDPAAAKKFYTSLFGWKANDLPIPDGGTYTMLENADGKAVCALYKNQQPGVPPHWGLYVTVTSASDAQKKAESLGAKTLMAAFDVMDVGRMAVLQDPTGAVINVWEAKKHQGFGVVQETHTFCWAELVTPNTDVAGTFYKGLFGWGLKPSSHDAMQYTELQLGTQSIGGMMPPPMKGIPPHWAVYFFVPDVDVATKKAQSLGATVTVPPQAIPNVGRFSVIQDPTGAHFSLYEAVKK
jgi:predicted enzyme related to lactoylglutathione lyase